MCLCNDSFHKWAASATSCSKRRTGKERGGTYCVLWRCRRSSWGQGRNGERKQKGGVSALKCDLNKHITASTGVSSYSFSITIAFNWPEVYNKYKAQCSPRSKTDEHKRCKLQLFKTLFLEADALFVEQTNMGSGVKPLEAKANRTIKVPIQEQPSFSICSKFSPCIIVSVHITGAHSGPSQHLRAFPSIPGCVERRRALWKLYNLQNGHPDLQSVTRGPKVILSEDFSLISQQRTH